MYKMHEKSPLGGTQRSKKVFKRGLNRSIPFHFKAHFSEPFTILFSGTVSYRSVRFGSVSFSCERGLNL